MKMYWAVSSSIYARDQSKTAVIDYDAITWPTEEERRERERHYDEIAADFYHLVSQSYERGWCVLSS